MTEECLVRSVQIRVEHSSWCHHAQLYSWSTILVLCSEALGYSMWEIFIMACQTGNNLWIDTTETMYFQEQFEDSRS